MANTRIEVLAILRHYFKLDLRASEATHRIQEKDRNETISDCTAQKLFKDI